jgi:uncharacterized protein YecE (DUF72 family)
MLTRHGAALCWADRRERPTGPLWRTADWVYLRLHEGRGQAWPAYDEPVLRWWARRVAQVLAGGDDAYVYFNNGPGSAFLRDALRFRELVATGG